MDAYERCGNLEPREAVSFLKGHDERVEHIVVVFLRFTDLVGDETIAVEERDRHHVRTVDPVRNPPLDGPVICEFHHIDHRFLSALTSERPRDDSRHFERGRTWKIGRKNESMVVHGEFAPVRGNEPDRADYRTLKRCLKVCGVAIVLIDLQPVDIGRKREELDVVDFVAKLKDFPHIFERGDAFDVVRVCEICRWRQGSHSFIRLFIGSFLRGHFGPTGVFRVEFLY